MFNMIMELLYIFIIALNFGIIMINISYMEITKKNLLVINSVLFSIIVLLNNYNENKLIIPITTIIMSIYLYILFKKVYYALLISIFIQLIFAFGDAVTGVILVFILKIKYCDILNNPKIKLLTALLILIVCYFLSKFSCKVLKNNYVKNFLNIKSKNISILVSTVVISLISIYSYSLSLKMIFNKPNKFFISLNLFLIISYFIVILILTHTNNESIKKDLEWDYREKELAHLKEYTINLENLSNDLRSFRHDQINIFQTIGAYIESENIKGLKEFYYKELMPESKKILEKNRSYTSLMHIKIDSLKGLLSSKIIKAQSKNIKVKIEIVDDVNELSIYLIDICRIIGIVFDNAIEAAILCDNKFIEFLVYKNNNSTTFIIKNSCPENTASIHKIYEKNFSTKGVNRGIGLKTVKDILNEKYDNVYLNTSIDNFVFTQELIIVNN
ncbi:GHKL domain-containing protein [Clostridium sp. CM027]|uniref:sensor histidine kinase n=1 Tax=Clostridium sp. CM027 TaxID=2849865 RepID=UPI001C6DFDBD|nr:GHKL domain-containing protein [Clostridium sp. CM027]MBW9146028.1 GHKL domain-containing protein [Clostridium sp. CM027]UVE39498.1 GHKL domain-containing protein [Clostridium sp. CM027]